MLIEVLKTRKTAFLVAFAVCMWTVQWVLRTTVFTMDLTFMAEKASRISESRYILAANRKALIRALMLIHMFARE
jgi:hypothetical protein